MEFEGIKNTHKFVKNNILMSTTFKYGAEQLTVSVIDVTGRVVATQNWTTHGQTFYQGSFSISNIRTKGLYFVKIDGRTVRKLVIKK